MESLVSLFKVEKITCYAATISFIFFVISVVLTYIFGMMSFFGSFFEFFYVSTVILVPIWGFFFLSLKFKIENLVFKDLTEKKITFSRTGWNRFDLSQDNKPLGNFKIDYNSVPSQNISIKNKTISFV